MQNSCDLLITNANVVLPKIGVVNTNILIENEKIKDITKSIDNISCSKKINANEKYVLPGLIDPHVHYGVFSPIEQSSKTESRSATVGGITTIIRMLRSNESYEQNIAKHLKASEKNHYIDYAIHASILNTKQIADIPYLCKLGINSFKLYMNLGSIDNRILMDMKPGVNELIPEYIQVSDELCSDVLSTSSSSSCVLIPQFSFMQKIILCAPI